MYKNTQRRDSDREKRKNECKDADNSPPQSNIIQYHDNLRGTEDGKDKYVCCNYKPNNLWGPKKSDCQKNWYRRKIKNKSQCLSPEKREIEMTLGGEEGIEYLKDYKQKCMSFGGVGKPPFITNYGTNATIKWDDNVYHRVNERCVLPEWCRAYPDQCDGEYLHSSLNGVGNGKGWDAKGSCIRDNPDTNSGPRLFSIREAAPGGWWRDDKILTNLRNRLQNKSKFYQGGLSIDEC